MGWFDAASKAREVVKAWTGDVVLVFHDDADGLASASIAISALSQMKKEPVLYCIEKMYPEVVKKIHESHKNDLIIYLDIGSGEIDLLDSLPGRVIILDHHKTKQPTSNRVANLDPELFGISGDSEACSATLAYLFFKPLASIEKFMDLAIVGMQEIPGEPRGLNELVVKEFGKPVNSKLERFGKIPRSVSRDLTILGSVGYYSGGVEVALKLARNGYSREIKARIKDLEEKRKAVVRELVRSLKLKETKNVQWFDAGDAFKGMGVKTIGSFCSYLVHRNIAPDKILLGAMNVEKSIPRLNGIELELSRSYSKVSSRVPEVAKARIAGKEIPGLGVLLSKACSRIGGFADGHDFAASGIIPRGMMQNLVSEIERELEGGEQKGLGGWF